MRFSRPWCWVVRTDTKKLQRRTREEGNEGNCRACFNNASERPPARPCAVREAPRLPRTSAGWKAGKWGERSRGQKTAGDDGAAVKGEELIRLPFYGSALSPEREREGTQKRQRCTCANTQVFSSGGRGELQNRRQRREAIQSLDPLLLSFSPFLSLFPFAPPPTTHTAMASPLPPKRAAPVMDAALTRRVLSSAHATTPLEAAAALCHALAVFHGADPQQPGPVRRAASTSVR